jgi:hypothetical protein
MNVIIFFIVEKQTRKLRQERRYMKNAICLVLVILVVLFASTIPGYADGRGGSGYHGGGGYHGGSGYHGGGGWHGDGGHGGSSWHGSIWIGPGWGGWGPWWGPAYYPYPYPYYYPNYPYYPETPMIIQQKPQTYVQPEEQYFWYYCKKPEGYYPYIKECPGGWMKVVPPAPPDEKE